MAGAAVDRHNPSSFVSPLNSDKTHYSLINLKQDMLQRTLKHADMSRRE